MRSHAFVIVALAACKGAERPRPPAAAVSATIAITRDGFGLRGVAGDGTTTYASLARNGSPNPALPKNLSADPAVSGSIVEARRGETLAWSTPLGGTAGEMAVAGNQLAVAISARDSVVMGPDSGPTGTAMNLELRGDPAALVAALDRVTGKQRWQRPFESTEWALVSGVAALGDDIVVAGSFRGTLRVKDKVVTSAGGSDGFVARVSATGDPVWVVRLGGAGTDAIQGVATAKDRIAIAGTFSLGADILGIPLKSIEERSPFPDGFVAQVTADGARAWSATFGSRASDAVAGVTIDAAGHVVVAANVHEVLSLAGATLVPRGAGDGLVVWYGRDGELGNAVLVGGNDFDGLRSIVAVGDRIVVGGFFSGAIELADRALTAGGGDDSFIAGFDSSGTVAIAWHVGGAGREEITSLAAVGGGFVAGIAHSAGAVIDESKVAAPKDGMTGAALLVRGW